MSNRIFASRAGMLLLLALPWMHGWGATPAPSQPQLEKIQHDVESRFPRIHIDHVAPAPWPGLYAVFTDEEIVYTNASVDWILMGQLLDARTQKNMTAGAWDDFKRIDYSALPFDAAFTIVRGKGTRQIALFADPLCPFCQELETSLEGIDDLTVHLFLYPLETLHPGATTSARKIWCAPDRASAWRDWMLRQQEIPAKECGDGPIPRLAALGRALKIDSTPTLFLSDGRRISGTLPKAQLEYLLASPPPAAATSATDKP
jgi:thiol:disulfide interchange protein DsbC